MLVGNGGHANGRYSGGGGGLSWRNNIAVTPGESLVITRDAIKTQLARGAEVLCIANASTGVTGGLGGKGASSINDGGGNGGDGAYSEWSLRASGGGAGGYTSNGGNGTSTKSILPGISADGGNGGNYNATQNTATGGFGVTLLGANAPGYGGVPLGSTYPPGQDTTVTDPYGTPGFGGGRFGGGSATTGSSSTPGAPGGVRIIWGPNRAYPLTNTANV